MRIAFLISSLLWLIFIYFTYQYGTEGPLGGSVGKYIEAQEMGTYSLISWVIGSISIVFSIIGMIKIKRKGVKLVSILSLLIAAFICFWVAVMINDGGVDLDEIYGGLIGFGLAEILLSLIMLALAKKKK
jgi:hypothetical protein